MPENLESLMNNNNEPEEDGVFIKSFSFPGQFLMLILQSKQKYLHHRKFESHFDFFFRNYFLL